jgi:hypothetical protein
MVPSPDRIETELAQAHIVFTALGGISDIITPSHISHADQLNVNKLSKLSLKT